MTGAALPLGAAIVVLGPSAAPLGRRIADLLPAALLHAPAGRGIDAEIHFAAALPHLSWQPTDLDAEALASIAAHHTESGVANVLAPLALDVTARRWPVECADAIVCINMIHISPWSASEGLVAGAARTLAAGGVLYLYGPYSIGGEHTAPSNRAFDGWLRTQDARWGVRDLDDVAALAARHGLVLTATVPMPANNLSVIFRRQA